MRRHSERVLTFRHGTSALRMKPSCVHTGSLADDGSEALAAWNSAVAKLLPVLGT